MSRSYEELIASDLHFGYIKGGNYNISNKQNDWKTQPFDVILYVFNGRIRIQNSGRDFSLTCGESVFLPAYSMRRAKFCSDEGATSFLSVSFNVSCLGALNLLSLFDIPSRFDGKTATELCETISELIETQGNIELSPITRKAKTLKYGFTLLDILVRDSHYQSSKASILNRHHRLSTLLELLHKQPETYRSVDSMAQIVNISKPRLYQLFKEITGYAPLEYLRIQRLRKGVTLLLTTDRAIGDIAEELGYPDPFCFSKAFKKIFGVSPTFYRHDKTYW